MIGSTEEEKEEKDCDRKRKKISESRDRLDIPACYASLESS
jgi:hypothetical protein